MGHAEGDMAGFILGRQPADGFGDRIGCEPGDEPEQGKKSSLAEHGEQKGGDGEVGFVDQRF